MAIVSILTVFTVTATAATRTTAKASMSCDPPRITEFKFLGYHRLINSETLIGIAVELKFQTGDSSNVGYHVSFDGELLGQNWIFDEANTDWSARFSKALDKSEWTAGEHVFSVEVAGSCLPYQKKEVAVNFPATLKKRPYLALGDSYSSGEGNSPYNLSQSCHRSSKSWPTRVGSEFGRKVINLACSGAKMADLARTFKSEPSQLQLVGQIQPDIVTVTIGGNDLGFAKVVRDCFWRDCVRDGTLADVGRALKKFQAKLEAEYNLIKQYADTGQLVVVVGYPEIFPTASDALINCSWLNSREHKGLYEITERLDKLMHDAALAIGVEYVSTLQALWGHELCTEDPWLYPVGVPPLAAGGHPDHEGQAAIANEVMTVG